MQGAFGYPSMPTIGEAIVWPSRTQDWFSRVLLMALIGLIPIVGQMALYGWTLGGVDNLRAGRQELPPAGFAQLGRGARVFVVLLLYGLLVAVLVLIGEALLLVPMAATRGHAWAAPLAPLLALPFFGLYALLGVAIYFFLAPLILITDREGIGAALNPRRVASVAFARPGDTAVTGLMLLVTQLLASFGVILCFVGVYLTAAYAAAMQAWVLRSFEVGRPAYLGLGGPRI